MAGLPYTPVERPDPVANATPPVAHLEVLSLPLRHLAELPLATTLTLAMPALDAVAGRPVALLLTTSRARAQQATREAREGGTAGRDHGWLVCLTPVEYEALAVALADGRVLPIEAAHELARKAVAAREGAEYRLTRERLLGPVRRPDGGGEAWTVGQLLEALRATLAGVVMEGGAEVGT